MLGIWLFLCESKHCWRSFRATVWRSKITSYSNVSLILSRKIVKRNKRNFLNSISNTNFSHFQCYISDALNMFGTIFLWDSRNDHICVADCFHLKLMQSLLFFRTMDDFSENSIVTYWMNTCTCNRTNEYQMFWRITQELRTNSQSVIPLVADRRSDILQPMLQWRQFAKSTWMLLMELSMFLGCSHTSSASVRRSDILVCADHYLLVKPPVVSTSQVQFDKK